MRFFPLKAGLHIGSQYLALVVLEKHRNVYRLNAAQVAELPSGLIQPSPANLNISDIGEFHVHLKKLLQPIKGIKAISLSLPDPSVRAALLSANSLPVKGSDRDQLIRWQMEKIFLAPLGSAKVVYQPIPSPRKTLLAVTIQSEILQQYEDAIRRLGIQPIWVNISSFQLINLYHDLLLQLAGASGRFIVLNLFDHNFTLMIFGDGTLDFIRIKGLRSAPALSFASGEESGGSYDNSLSDLIMHELKTSLSFYSQSQDPSLVTHLFVFGRKMSEFIKKAHNQYHIEVEPLEPERLAFLGGLAKVRPEEIGYVTPAIAAAIEGAIELTLVPSLTSIPKIFPWSRGIFGRSQRPDS